MPQYFSVFCLIMALFSTSLFAQQAPNPTTNDPEAQKLLDQLSKRYKSYKSMKALFSLEISIPDQEPVKQTGKADMKGEKFKIELGDQEITCDNKTLWTFLKNENEVQISKYEKEEGGINSPAQLFTIYEGNYFYRMAGETTDKGQLIEIVELTPVDKKQSFSKIKLYISRKDLEIRSAQIFERSGIRYLWNIEKLTPNLDLPDNYFTFDLGKYPGISVVDLR